MNSFVLGLDFGSDSVRALVADAGTGQVAGMAVSSYRRWSDGLYCSPLDGRYRQHPLDYLEGLEEAVRGALDEAGSAARHGVRAISVDTTASTPCLVDEHVRPLALDPAFSEDPDAMFFLWKDHTSVAEAGAINAWARTWGGADYTRFSGGAYSAEWYWAKALHVMKANPGLAAAASSFLEHCDWIPALLCGREELAGLRRGRGAAGHKALWHAAWGGYPPEAFWSGLDPRLGVLAAGLDPETHVGGASVGRLCPRWAARLGLEASVVVAAGTVDAHTGAFGAGIRPGRLVQILGTSACDILIGPLPEAEERPIRGICGQVDGSVIGGYAGYEAGQSAFGDVLAWYRDLLLWPSENALGQERKLLGRDSLFSSLEEAARGIEPGVTDLVALDWFNGRRSPDDDPGCRGAIAGLGLGSCAPAIYRSLIESLAFGSRAIVDRFKEEGLAVEGVIATGGIPRKNRLLMRIMADVLGMEIAVPSSDQTVALGAAMFAALAANLHPDALSAQEAMASPLGDRYQPDPGTAAAYSRLYRRYRELGAGAGRP